LKKIRGEIRKGRQVKPTPPEQGILKSPWFATKRAENTGQTLMSIFPFSPKVNEQATASGGRLPRGENPVSQESAIKT